MRIGMLPAILAALLIVACGSEDPGSGEAGSGLTLPVTLEGTLAADVAEGEVDEGGYSDVNFGTLTVDGEALGVQVSGAVLRSAGLQDGTGKVRARLTARADEYGWPVYTVSALQRLEARP